MRQKRNVLQHYPTDMHQRKLRTFMPHTHINIVDILLLLRPIKSLYVMRLWPFWSFKVQLARLANQIAKRCRQIHSNVWQRTRVLALT